MQQRIVRLIQVPIVFRSCQRCWSNVARLLPNLFRYFGFGDLSTGLTRISLRWQHATVIVISIRLEVWLVSETRSTVSFGHDIILTTGRFLFLLVKEHAILRIGCESVDPRRWQVIELIIVGVRIGWTHQHMQGAVA